jgi:two-component system, OmpR family, alkaline phosphatase synthesis response regulator PhoP
MSQKRILLVDDDPGLTALLDLIFRRAKFEVVVANNGYDGLKKAIELTPALILLDIMMPDINGIEVCKMLRETPITADLPILILSASGNKEDRDMALAAGADAFIQKPVSPSELITRVNSLLEEKITL